MLRNELDMSYPDRQLCEREREREREIERERERERERKGRNIFDTFSKSTETTFAVVKVPNKQKEKKSRKRLPTRVLNLTTQPQENSPRAPVIDCSHTGTAENTAR